MKEPEISVIVCTYKRAASLHRVLTNLVEQDVSPVGLWELIVVDNNSTDDTHSVVERFSKRFPGQCKYVFEKQQGLSHARNAGIAAASGAIVAFTDDDVSVDHGWVRGIADAFARFKCIGVGGKIIPLWENGKPSWLPDSGPYMLMSVIPEYDFGSTPMPTNVPPVGANMAFRKEAFVKYGLFRTDLGVCGTTLMLGEDTELCKRLMDAGEIIMYCPDAVVTHPVEPRRGRKEFYMMYYHNFGKTEMRMKKKAHFACWFGVPRYLFRRQAGYLVNWLFSWSPDRRFYYKLHSLRIAGSIREAFSGNSKTMS